MEQGNTRKILPREKFTKFSSIKNLLCLQKTIVASLHQIVSELKIESALSKLGCIELPCSGADTTSEYSMKLHRNGNFVPPISTISKFDGGKKKRQLSHCLHAASINISFNNVEKVSTSAISNNSISILTIPSLVSFTAISRNISNFDHLNRIFLNIIL